MNNNMKQERQNTIILILLVSLSITMIGAFIHTSANSDYSNPPQTKEQISVGFDYNEEKNVFTLVGGNVEYVEIRNTNNKTVKVLTSMAETFKPNEKPGEKFNAYGVYGPIEKHLTTIN